MNKAVLNYINAIFIGIFAIFLIILFQNIYINQDASYYLSIARDISEGTIMYRDIPNAYTPFMMYVNSIWFCFIEDPSIHFFIGFQITIILLIGWVFYKIQRKQKHTRQASIYMSLVLMFAILELDGTFIVLEPYCILFFLLSYLCILNKQYFISGVLIALCVLSKQYGVLNILPLFLLIMAFESSNTNKWKANLKFILGGLIVLCIFLTYFIILQGVEFKELFNQLSGKSYAESHFSITFNYLSLLAAKYSWLIILLTIIVAKKTVLNKVSIILFLGFFLNLIPLLVQAFPHYFLLSLPYAFLFYSYNVKRMNPSIFYIFAFVVGIFILKFTWSISSRKKIYNQQVDVSKQLEKIYPIGSNVFIHGGIRYLYLLNNYKNPLKHDLGYAFEYDLDTIDTKNVKILSEDDLKEMGIINP